MITRIVYVCLFLLPLMGYTQNLKVMEEYLRLDAAPDDPLYTTYTAAMKRSRLYGDQGYHLNYYSNNQPVTYESDPAGKLYCIWKIDDVVVRTTGEFLRTPVVRFSFPDMAILDYEPFRGIRVRETFFVYSSSIALVEMEVTNTDNQAHEITVYPIMELGNDSLEVIRFDTLVNGYITHRYETPYRLISSLKMDYGYPTQLRDLFCSYPSPSTYGAYPGNMPDFYTTIKTDFYSGRRSDELNMYKSGYVNFISLQLKKRLRKNERVVFRYIRGIQDKKSSLVKLIDEVNSVKNQYLRTFYEDNLILFSRVPQLIFPTRVEKLVYLSAFNLARGSMLPASGETTHNFYVFSRYPLWGWGHGHQVLHESLSMIPYAYMDGESAKESQRVYMDQQRADGLIAYRHGPRGLQDYPHKGMSTTSAPFYNWINREIYDITKDSQFLEQSYISGVKYMNWLIENRDTDHDGTFEWGPYGLIENVRDWYNAVFQVSAERYLDIDKEDISDELECLDLTVMMINESRHLAYMAEKLGKIEDAKRWKQFSTKTAQLVNERMWDDSTGFYYSVNKYDHGWFFMTRDLRRQEIIGFLPLWAGIVPPGRADTLIRHLTDSTKFWRRYGVPTLAADDPWFNPNVDYCCKWNGPVWLLWNYMVYTGLKKSGYDSLAHELAGKMLDAVVVQLKKNHRFWESYSPDNEVLNSPENYIWDAIIAKILLEEHENGNRY